MIEDFLNVLKDNNILLAGGPANMRHIFHLHDLMVNRTLKTFTHKTFSEWYGREILHALENSCETMDAKVIVKLTIMKPLYARLLSEFYNYINSSDGQEVTRNGWLRTGIT